jgi:riboflavin synthase
MFNGIIKNKGKIVKIYKKNLNCTLEILTKMYFTKNDIGSSISCSGACLTLEGYNKRIAKFFLSHETLKKTIFKFIKEGDEVNLERSLRFKERMSGHFVQGHVDTICEVKKIYNVGRSWLINFKLNNKYKKYIVEKGSITINGVSLTIANIYKWGFQIAVVPHTLKLTNLLNLKAKDFVNIEFDVLGKYIKNFLKK